MEEFGKLKLDYYPERIGVFSGSNGVAYVLMAVKNELIVFIIQAIFKQPSRRNPQKMFNFTN